MPLRPTEPGDRYVRQVAGALGRREHDGSGAVGLEAAVELAEGLGDERRGEIVVEGHFAPPHQRFLIQLRMPSARQSNICGIGRLHVEEPHVPAEVEGVPLRGRAHAVRRIPVTAHLGEGSLTGLSLRPPATITTERRIAFPAEGYEHVAGDPAMQRHRCGLQRCHRARTAHVYRNRVAHVRYRKIRGDLLDGEHVVRDDDAVDVRRPKPGVGDGCGGGVENHLGRRPSRAADVLGFGDPDDRRATGRIRHSPCTHRTSHAHDSSTGDDTNLRRRRGTSISMRVP